MSRALFAMSLVSILLSGLGTSFHTHAQMRWQESGGGSNYVGFSAPASVSTNTIWTLPAADGGAVNPSTATRLWAERISLASRQQLALRAAPFVAAAGL